MSVGGGEEMIGHRVTAVVPVKRLALAKSRLEVPAEQRQTLALAFALDTITSLAACPHVTDILVVTSDPVVARRVRPLGARVTTDQGIGLEPSVAGGLQAAATWRPGTGVAVVPADLPCLRPDDVTRVLTAAADSPGAFVPDRSGTGTTLVVYPPGLRALTRYGPGSATGHRALGLRALPDAPLRARHDVDTLADLAEAEALGVGAETDAVLEALAGVTPRRPSIR